MKIDVVSDQKCLLAEGPVWDAKRKLIYWIDILNGKIHEYSHEEKSHRITDVHQMIGSLAICDDGNFIAALQNGIAFINRSTHEITPIADPETHLEENRFNEGKCDPAGRFWAGTMSLSETPNAGNLYVLEHRVMLVKKISGVTISNGMAWSPDEKTFYFIDTPTHEIDAYSYDKITAGISDRKTIIRIDEKEGAPDGMTIDNEGMLWIAHWGGWQVSRWDPTTGKKLYAIKMPAARITSCTFGGENLQDLYITSAQQGLTPDELKDQPLAGSLFVIYNCGFKGMPAVEFKV